MNNSEHESNWQAFCYLTGELSPTEHVQFEEQLGTNQSAREALAYAVQLHYAVQMGTVQLDAGSSTHAVSQSVVVHSTVANPNRRFSQVAAPVCTIAACLFVMLAWFNLPTQQNSPVADSNTETTSELVAIWTQTNLNAGSLDSTPKPGSDSLYTPARISDSLISSSTESVLAEAEDFLNHPFADDANVDLQEELAVPDWIFSALVTADEQDLPDSDFEIQEN